MNSVLLLFCALGQWEESGADMSRAAAASAASANLRLPERPSPARPTHTVIRARYQHNRVIPQNSNKTNKNEYTRIYYYIHYLLYKQCKT